MRALTLTRALSFTVALACCAWLATGNPTTWLLYATVLASATVFLFTMGAWRMFTREFWVDREADVHCAAVDADLDAHDAFYRELNRRVGI